MVSVLDGQISDVSAVSFNIARPTRSCSPVLAGASAEINAKAKSEYDRTCM
jgi:hypothetical protein